MNVAYLTKILGTEKLSEVVANIDAIPLDMNLAIWDAVDRGEVEVDDENDHIKLLKEPSTEADSELVNKVLRVVEHYASRETNITRGRLNSQVKDPISGQGYPWHEYIMAVQHLIDNGTIVQAVIDVPQKTTRFNDKKGRKKEKIDRPAHKFAFLGLPKNSEVNEEWNAQAVNKWIADMDANTVK